MQQEDPGLEQRLSRFEAQLDRFSLALHQWQTQDRTQGTASDVDQRIRALEETVGREAHALRQMHEEPLKQLQAHVESLKALCDAASQSVHGLDHAESRLAELQQNVGVLVTELSRSLQSLADLRPGDMANSGNSAISTRGPAAVWPLERVVHLHDELRRTGNGGNALTPAAALRQERPADSPRVFQAVSVEPEVSARPPDGSPRSRGRLVAALSGGVAALILVILSVRWVESRLNDAADRVAAAEQQVVATTRRANEEVVAARQDANQQIAEARLLAQRAETVGSILTAPDLVRFSLTSSTTGGSSAQILWSRTRGLVMSGSRLPALAPENTYQLWLMTSTQPVSAGLFAPDPAGRATLVIDTPPRVAGPLAGASITVEPKGGRLSPTGQILLMRAFQP